MKRFQLLKTLLLAGLATGLATPLAIADNVSSTEDLPVLRVTVNSSSDGPVAADAELTLREAISLSNGILTLEQLSAAEKAQVERLAAGDRPEITFNLPTTTPITLTDLLPEITRPTLLIDGSTQPGYGSGAVEANTPPPAVAITTAATSGVFRGLTIVADNVTVRGLSLYGFTTQNWGDEAILPADILVAHRLPPPDTSTQYLPNSDSPFNDENIPPQGVVIEQNWLGISPTGEPATIPSAFGVYILQGIDTVVQQNFIAAHSGSGVITSVRATGLEISENQFTDNGSRGMPDAIRLEGEVAGTQIRQNEIYRSYGSGVFLFKTSGAVTIQANQLEANGQRLEQAAIYLMGNDHQVIDNVIRQQNGPGVVVAAYPQSDRNQILHNRFEAIKGLSIDLTARRQTGETHYQRGDGPNPLRNSRNRRQDTANNAINAPQFLSRDFLIRNGQVILDGVADPGSVIELYLSQGTTEDFGPLSEPVATIQTDEQGRFSYTATNLQPGDTFSAIATDPRYGTSEPARNATIRLLAELGTADY
ncbi:right-handed parallel beta-helix repeat-containing protein [Almyronema epifaneia]|uniref:Right-handed parallel beta-helix repeat-containing protein n=1 Tax=Almyronema epifaneia S1 TaxID=2991925 RepID=A0ABW6IGW7_9CYAN